MKLKKIYDIKKIRHNNETDNYASSFQQFETIRYFAKVFDMLKVF